MEKEELLTFLSNNVSCFKDVEPADFYFLLIIDSNELGFMNEKVARVTPLLKQICEYSLLNEVINLAEFEDIGVCFGENDVVFIESMKVLEKCYDYIKILLNEHCNHPSINNAINVSSCLCLYDELMTNISELVFNMETASDDSLTDYGNTQDRLIDYGNNVDDKITSIISDIFDILKNRIESGVITTKEELLSYLSNYAKNKINLMLLLSKVTSMSDTNTNNHIFYSDDKENVYVNVLENAKFFPNSNLTLYDSLNSLNMILKLVNKYEQENFYDISYEQQAIINNIKEAHYLYQSYKYKYLKTSYREQKLLEKCKKL